MSPMRPITAEAEPKAMPMTVHFENTGDEDDEEGGEEPGVEVSTSRVSGEAGITFTTVTGPVVFSTTAVVRHLIPIRYISRCQWRSNLATISNISVESSLC
jgi:hypothetical protein